MSVFGQRFQQKKQNPRQNTHSFHCQHCSQKYQSKRTCQGTITCQRARTGQRARTDQGPRTCLATRIDQGTRTKENSQGQFKIQEEGWNWNWTWGRGDFRQLWGRKTGRRGWAARKKDEKIRSPTKRASLCQEADESHPNTPIQSPTSLPIKPIRTRRRKRRWRDGERRRISKHEQDGSIQEAESECTVNGNVKRWTSLQGEKRRQWIRHHKS